MSSSLLPEIWWQVFTYLTAKELFAIRLLSRTFYIDTKIPLRKRQYFELCEIRRIALCRDSVDVDNFIMNNCRKSEDPKCRQIYIDFLAESRRTANEISPRRRAFRAMNHTFRGLPLLQWQQKAFYDWLLVSGHVYVILEHFNLPRQRYRTT